MAPKIKFGTDGWRGLIGEDFNLANVRVVAKALAAYLRSRRKASAGVVVGYDMRFLSEESAHCAAETLASEGIPVILGTRPAPTPAVSFAVVSHHAATGLMVTASHNPYRWNGIKIKAHYGGSASPSIVKSIERSLTGGVRVDVKRRRPAAIRQADFVPPYLERIRSLVNLKGIRASGFRFAIDPMYGAGRTLLAQLFEEAGIPHTEIHGEHNPLFPGLNPEPIDPHLNDLRRTVTSGRFDAGFATDGDADRVGALDRAGTFIDSHKIFSLLLKHLAGDRGKRGEVVRTFSTTQMIDKIARKYHLSLHVTPIGFKYICELMLTRHILIGGEESGGIAIAGHLPERDGILISLLLAELMAERSRTLGELVQELQEEYGPHYYGRVDLEISRDAIERTLKLAKERKLTELAGKPILATEDLDGIKMKLSESEWVLVRASGTENLLRLYAEGASPDEVQTLLRDMTQRAKTQ
jgi:phosphomannomutase